MKLVHVISHLVFCTELLGWLFIGLFPEKSGVKDRGVQGSFSWLVLPKLALLCLSYNPQIYITVWFLGLFLLHSNHWEEKTQQADYEVDLFQLLFSSQCLPSLPGTSVWGSTLEKFKLLISCYCSRRAMVHKPAVIFHTDSTQILFV